MRRHRIGYAAGALCSAACISVFLSPQYERLRSPGAANVGHETLACNECHREAKGTMRQQLQANARWLIGLRDEPVDFGLIAVSSDDCTDCHQRSSDRHPIYRFFEPRFSTVRSAIAPHRCLSCHQEHTGRRVTIENGFCRHCHDGLEVANDRIDPTHEGIVAVGEWNACLRCHDFHGSHAGETPTSLLEGISTEDVEHYLDGGPSPWLEKRVLAKKTRSPR